MVFSETHTTLAGPSSCRLPWPSKHCTKTLAAAASDWASDAKVAKVVKANGECTAVPGGKPSGKQPHNYGKLWINGDS